MKKICCLQVLVDIFIFFGGIVGLYTLNLYVEPAKTGFYCDDHSIALPYKDKDAITLPYYCLLPTVAIWTLLSVVLLEPVALCSRDKGFSCATYLSNVCKTYGLFLVGTLLTMMLAEVGKIATGKLRPDFLDLCKPDTNPIKCAAGRYVQNYTCTNEAVTTWELTDARKAFPSTHSAVAAFAASYLIFFYHSRSQMACSLLFKMALQLAVAAGAVYVGCTRVSDNRHRISEVVAGFALGTVVAIWTVLSNNEQLQFVSRNKRHVELFMTGSPRDSQDGKGVHMPLYTR